MSEELRNTPGIAKALKALDRFEECASDGEDVDIGLDALGGLVWLGWIERVRGRRRRWQITSQGEVMLASATPPAASAGDDVITEAMLDAPRPLFLGVIGGGLSAKFTLADHMEAGGWSTAGLSADDLALNRPPTKRHAASMVYRMMRAALAADAGREGSR